MKNLLYIGNKLSVHGFTPTTIETLGLSFEGEGYIVHYASSKKNKIGRFLDMLLKTVRYQKQAHYVIIDTYSTSNFWYAFAVSQLCRILDLRYIPILHGGNLPNRLKKSPKLSAMIFNNAYKNIAPSRYLMHYFNEAQIKNLIYIPNTIAINEYPFKEREKVAPRLLWVRSFAKIYNPKMAVDVLKLLKTDYPEATLCMVGPEKDGSLQETKEYAKSLNLKVEFTGRLSKKEWASLASHYDIFINTTNFDNTPVSVVEAMALGLPVVTTNVGGIPFLVENNKQALLIPVGDVKAMANAIKEICDNQELAIILSQNGRELVECFDWHSVKQKWVEILR